MTLQDALPIKVLTTDQEKRQLIDQVNLLVNTVNANNTAISDGVLSLQDISMQSDKVILDETSTGLEFICEDDGILLEDS